MFDFQKNELFYAIGEFLDREIVSNNKRIVFWGINHQTRLSISFLLGCGIEKDKISIVDNSVKEEFRGIVTRRPEEVLFPYDSNIVILLATGHNKEIVKQAARYGYKKGKAVYELFNWESRLYKIGHNIRQKSPNRYNAILNGWGYQLYKATHRDVCQLTKQNEKYKDLHHGERCFIMGNGPSLGDVDFSKLEKEFVFGVNQIMSVPGWEAANINYWVCVDGDILGMWNNSDYSFYKKMLVLSERNIDVFVPVEARYYCRYHNLEEQLNINYMNIKEQYINLDCPMEINFPDMKKFIMQPYNAVIGCINIAIYMGFEEIYLLGCNQSVLEDEIKYYLGNQRINMHAYTDDDTSGKIALNRIRSKGMYFEIKTQLTQLLQYRLLNELCERNNIRLVNLSAPTLIESIPQMPIAEVLK
ncbi:MAG: hypothetical protein HDR02_12865 [Lachnospiraceae bacterium]|nr:hypothetical protein [Lachnospiraceae bacterium]